MPSIEVEQIEDGRIAYVDNVTVAIVNVNGQVGVGAAICMPSDKYSREIGKGIAVWRAIRSVAMEMETTWTSRAISKKEWKAKHRKGV